LSFASITTPGKAAQRLGQLVLISGEPALRVLPIDQTSDLILEIISIGSHYSNMMPPTVNGSVKARRLRNLRLRLTLVRRAIRLLEEIYRNRKKEATGLSLNGGITKGGWSRKPHSLRPGGRSRIPVADSGSRTSGKEFNCQISFGRQ